MSSSLASFFSSFISTSFADADESKPTVTEEVSSPSQEEEEVSSPSQEEEEEPEPEDVGDFIVFRVALASK